MRQLQKDPEGKNLNVTRRLTRPSMSNHSQMNNNNVKNGSNNNINNYHGANIDLGAQQAGHQKVSAVLGKWTSKLLLHTHYEPAPLPNKYVNFIHYASSIPQSVS